ncbi:MAG: RC-LH1 core complex protein PufX [Pseudomonadota bacterium]
MSDTNDVFTSGDRQAIRKEVTRQFLRGGGTGIAAFLGVIGFVVALWAVSLALPPESKEAADPTPDSFPHLLEDADS